jgi:flagellar L-ring protein precursor FlgH
VLPNNYLVVRGEKLITLNQSEDYIRFSGIVRPQDIGTDNSVESQKIANVQVSYSGSGPLTSANEMGPLAKFFNSQAYPY